MSSSIVKIIFILLYKSNPLETEFKIKFDGPEHEINANVLINNLIHTTTVIQEINRNLDSGKKIEIKIKALEKGSFLVHIDLIESLFDGMKNLLTRENLAVGGLILTAFVDLVALKKFLKGTEAQSKTNEGDKVKIINGEGQVIYIENFVNNIYENNTIVRDALSQSFETLENDSSISGYEITDKHEKPLVRVERQDFDYMAKKSEEILEGEKKIVVSATLHILRISFDNNLQSDFYYKGNKISVKIKDPDFQTRIDKGESFAKGDVLEVELEIKQKFIPAVNTYVNYSYKIQKITNHIGREEQSKMDFPKE